MSQKFRPRPNKEVIKKKEKKKEQASKGIEIGKRDTFTASLKCVHGSRSTLAWNR